MAGNISFYGKVNETVESNDTIQQRDSLAETTGSLGFRAFNGESIPNIDRTLANDTVNFRGNIDYEDNSSPLSTVVGAAGMAALAVLGLGYAKKTNAISKINNKKARNIINKMAEPCYKMYCKVESLSKTCYDKVVNFFKRKK